MLQEVLFLNTTANAYYPFLFSVAYSNYLHGDGSYNCAGTRMTYDQNCHTYGQRFGTCLAPHETCPAITTTTYAPWPPARK